MKLSDGISAYPWRNLSANNCNSYVIRTDRIILLDPGHRRFVEQLFLNMRVDGIFEDRIGLVITTHSHPDHFEGVEAFYNRPLLMAMNRKEHLYLRKVGEAFYRMMGMSLPQYRVDFFLKEGELRIGQETFWIIEVPGHSPGSLCIYWPKEKALFSGDVLFAMGIGRTDFPGGDGEQLLEGIKELSELDIEILLPGHGEILVGKERVRKNFDYVLGTFSANL